MLDVCSSHSALLCRGFFISSGPSIRVKLNSYGRTVFRISDVKFIFIFSLKFVLHSYGRTDSNILMNCDVTKN
jgi:hypothetical protein